MSSRAPSERSAERAGALKEGAVAGAIGAATIAIWFLILDTLRGHPLFTPTLLGTALLRRQVPAASLGNLPFSPGIVLGFTLIHGAIFAGIGVMAAYLLRFAEKNANYGFGIILLMVFVLSGFFFVSMVFAAEILHALSWPAVLVGNLLAVGAMAAYFRHRHSGFRMLP